MQCWTSSCKSLCLHVFDLSMADWQLSSVAAALESLSLLWLMLTSFTQTAVYTYSKAFCLNLCVLCFCVRELLRACVPCHGPYRLVLPLCHISFYMCMCEAPSFICASLRVCFFFPPQGTPERLIMHLVEEPSVVDPTYIEDFLLTYRTFLSNPMEVGKKLLEWFQVDSLRDTVSSCVCSTSCGSFWYQRLSAEESNEGKVCVKWSTSKLYLIICYLLR